jgi:hypothetical protein
MQKFAAIVLFSFLLGACHVPTGSESTDNGDQILFLAYEMNTDSLGGISTRIVNQIKSDGTFKPSEPLQPEAGDVVIQFLDKKNNEIKTEVIRNPFVKKMESVNDEGRLVRVTSRIERAELTVRTKYETEMKKISILLKGEPDKILLTHDLNTNQ